MIIAIIGEKLSGKDSAADYLVKNYGASEVRTSKILDELLQVLGLPISRQNEIEAGRGMEMVFGPRVIGEAVLKRVQSISGKIVVINGIRRKDQLENAKQLGAKILYITAPVELRHQRSLARKEKNDDGELTLQEFVEQDRQWIEIEIPAFGAQADFKIENTGSLEDLYKQLDRIF